MQNQFSRTELLIGKPALDTLASSRIAVFGIGGVGSYVTEVLARSGIGELDIIDNDRVCPTNINRQLYALLSTIGKNKVDVAEERILDINSHCIVRKYQMFYLPENADAIDLKLFDYVVDCVDTVSAKLELIKRCHRFNIPIISSMGAANKLDATAFRVADINETHMDPLAKVIRKKLRKLNIPRLKVVYSEEEPIRQIAYPTVECAEHSHVPASNAWVPAAAGLIIGGEVIKDLIAKAKTMRILPEESEGNADAGIAAEKAARHEERYKSIVQAKENGIWIDDKIVIKTP